MDMETDWGSMWGGMEASEADINKNDSDKNDPALMEAMKAQGPLPKSVKSEINAANTKFKVEIANIAHKAECDLKSCYNYLDANNKVPRAVNYFNIFQIWYGVNGKKSCTSKSKFVYLIVSSLA